MYSVWACHNSDGVHCIYPLSEKALKCKPSALIFGHGHAKDACARRKASAHVKRTCNGKYTEKAKDGDSYNMAVHVVLVATTSSSLPHYSR